MLHERKIQSTMPVPYSAGVSCGMNKKYETKLGVEEI